MDKLKKIFTYILLITYIFGNIGGVFAENTQEKQDVDLYFDNDELSLKSPLMSKNTMSFDVDLYSKDEDKLVLSGRGDGNAYDIYYIFDNNELEELGEGYYFFKISNIQTISNGLIYGWNEECYQDNDGNGCDFNDLQNYVEKYYLDEYQYISTKEYNGENLLENKAFLEYGFNGINSSWYEDADFLNDFSDVIVSNYNDVIIDDVILYQRYSNKVFYVYPDTLNQLLNLEGEHNLWSVGYTFEDEASALLNPNFSFTIKELKKQSGTMTLGDEIFSGGINEFNDSREWINNNDIDLENKEYLISYTYSDDYRDQDKISKKDGELWVGGKFYKWLEGVDSWDITLERITLNTQGGDYVLIEYQKDFSDPSPDDIGDILKVEFDDELLEFVDNEEEDECGEKGCYFFRSECDQYTGENIEILNIKIPTSLLEGNLDESTILSKLKIKEHNKESTDIKKKSENGGEVLHNFDKPKKEIEGLLFKRDIAYTVDEKYMKRYNKGWYGLGGISLTLIDVEVNDIDPVDIYGCSVELEEDLIPYLQYAGGSIGQTCYKLELNNPYTYNTGVVYLYGFGAKQTTKVRFSITPISGGGV